MSKFKIFLSEPEVTGNEELYLRQAFSKNQIMPLGDQLNQFELDLENYTDSNVLCVNSGSSAIHLCLKSLDIKPNDYVLVSQLTFAASAFPVLYENANPVFVGSEAETLNMCPDLLRKAILDLISKGILPKAIILVHLYGMPAKMGDIVAISKEYNIPIIEDAAEAIGSKYNKKSCGTFGHFGVYSFNGNKLITTGGGGAVICQNIKHKSYMFKISTQAKETDFNYYYHKEIGYNYRMSNISAAIGRGQLETLDDKVRKRINIYNYYDDEFRKFNDLISGHDLNDKAYSNRWLSIFFLTTKTLSKISVDDMINELKKHGIEARRIWSPLNISPIFSKFKVYSNSITDEIFKSGICLPSSCSLSKKQQDEVISVISLKLKSI